MVTPRREIEVLRIARSSILVKRKLGAKGLRAAHRGIWQAGFAERLTCSHHPPAAL